MDSAGSAISNARVTVLRPSTRTHIEVTTNDTGVYTVPNLVPGTYNITAGAATLASQEIQGLTLEVGQNVEENFTLSPATVDQEIVITTALPVAVLAGRRSSKAWREPLGGNFPFTTGVGACC